MANLQFPPIFFALLIATAVSASLSVIAWTRRPASGSGAIAILMLGVTLWTGFNAFEETITNFAVKQMVDAFCYTGILLVSPAWFIFTLNYTAWGSAIPHKNYRWLALEPILVILCLTVPALTDLFYPNKYLVNFQGYVYLVLEHGPLFWVHAIYSYFLVATGSFALLYHMLRSSTIFKIQTFVLILAMIPPWLANILYVSKVSVVPGLDLTPFTFMLSGLLIILGVFRYRLLDLTPLGRAALIEVMDDAVVVIDSMNRIVDINKTACSFLMKERNQVIGHPLTDYMESWPVLIEKYTQIFDIHETIAMDVFGANRNFDLKISPIYGVNGQVAGKLIIFRDIRDTFLAQEALRESENRYRLLVETFPDAVLMTNLHGSLVLFNQVAAEITGCPPGESLVGQSVFKFVPNEERDKIRQVSKNALNSEELQKIEFTAQSLAGKQFPAELFLTAAFDQSHKSNGFIGVLRDLSEQKKSEEHLHRLVESEHSHLKIENSLREIGVILTQSLDFEATLDILLEQVVKLVPFDSGNITLVKGKNAIIARSLGYEKFGVDIPNQISNFMFSIQETSNFKWMIENKKALAIPDTQDYPGWVRIEETSYIRSWIGAPIIARGEVLAFFNLDNCVVNFYTEEHTYILSAMAAQAGLALQNALLYRETMEMLDRTRRLNDILQRIGGSLDISLKLDDILKLSCELIGAQGSILSLYDAKDKILELKNIYETVDHPLELVPYKTSGLNWKVFQTGEPVLITDTISMQEPTDFLNVNRIRSILIVPVMAGHEMMGTLNFFNFDLDHGFQERDLPAAITLGREAGEVIQNAHLYEAAQRRAEEADTLREASNAVTSALNLDHVLDQIITNLDKVVPFDSCTIFLRLGEMLKVVAARGFEESEKLIGQMYPLNDQLTMESYTTRRAVVLADAQKDPRFRGWGDSEHIHGWMGIPLIARGDVTGYLTIDSCSADVYTQEDSTLAQAFANQAAIAIENARLYEQTEQLATSNSLTGLFNRRYFFELARNEFYRARRYNNPMALMMVDVDDLKLVNDTYGHLAGDRLIEFIGDRSRQVLRQVDIPARYAGDEFVILLPETSLEKAVKVGGRLQKSLSKGIEYDENQRIPISVSIGVSSLEEGCFSLEMLINRADQALYAAKHSGKNRLFVWKNGEFKKFEGEGAEKDKTTSPSD